MSFGFSVGDFVLLTQLAWTIVQNSRKACGAHDELTREVTSLHIVLQRLQHEAEKPNSLINRTDDGRLEELQTIVKGCNGMLKVIDQVLVKYNGMSEEKRRVARFRLKVKFGNGEMKDMGKIRQELSTYTSAITLFLNLLSMGSQGKVEEHMESHGEELRILRHSLNWITATLQANSGNREGSILTSYGDDDKAIWKEFRRELLKEGFSSEELRRHKGVIKDYVMELGARGALDVSEADGPIVEMKDVVEKTAESGKGKEIERETSPAPKSTTCSSRNSESLSDKEASSTAENSIDRRGELFDYTSQSSNSSTHSEIRPEPSNRISTTPLQAGTISIPVESNEAKELIPSETGKMNQTTLRSQHASDSDSSDSEPLLDNGTDAMQDTQDTAHNAIPVQKNEKAPTLLPSLAERRNPKPVSIEEIVDADFRPGEHPNCESGGTMADEYDDFISDAYFDDDATESSEYEENQSEGDLVSSSDLSPDDWRNKPALLWRETENAGHSLQNASGDDFGAENSGDGSGASSQKLHATDAAVDTYKARSAFPTNVAGVHLCGDGNGTTSSKSGSSRTNDLMSDISELSKMDPRPLKEIDAFAIQKSIEKFGVNPFLGRQPETTTSTRALRSRSKGRNRRQPRKPRPHSESEEESSRRRDSPRRRRSAMAHRDVQEYLSAGPADTMDYLVDGIIYRLPVGPPYSGRLAAVPRDFMPRHISSVYYCPAAADSPHFDDALYDKHNTVRRADPDRRY